jgi:hypothetical protein
MVVYTERIISKRARTEKLDTQFELKISNAGKNTERPLRATSASGLPPMHTATKLHLCSLEAPKCVNLFWLSYNDPGCAHVFESHPSFWGVGGTSLWYSFF